MSDTGCVIWLTGLSGAGKSTIANQLVSSLQKSGRAPILLDGDQLRAVFADRFGFADDERRYLAGCYGRLCAELSSQGHLVICSTISMFHSVRDWNRANIDHYLEVFLDVDLAERRRRDPKGLYQRDDGKMVCEIHYEMPRTPDLHIHNQGEQTVDVAVEMIFAQLEARGWR